MQELINEEGEKFITIDKDLPFNDEGIINKYTNLNYNKLLYVNYFVDLNTLQLGIVLPDGVKDRNHYILHIKGYNIVEQELYDINADEFAEICKTLE